MYLQIAIDGVSGAGKSKVTKLLSKKVGFSHINTGIFFRAITYYYLSTKNNDIKAVIDDIKKTKKLLFKNNMAFLEDKCITSFLFSNEVTEKVGFVSDNPEVREFVLDLERKIAENENVIMEGRDIGSTVFPNSFLKIFLNASIEVRAERRFKQLKKNEQIGDLSLEELKKIIKKRDDMDFQRKISPLIKCADAHVIYTDCFTAEEVVELIYELFLKKGGKINF